MKAIFMCSVVLGLALMIQAEAGVSDFEDFQVAPPSFPVKVSLKEKIQGQVEKVTSEEAKDLDMIKHAMQNPSEAPPPAKILHPLTAPKTAEDDEALVQVQGHPIRRMRRKRRLRARMLRRIARLRKAHKRRQMRRKRRQMRRKRRQNRRLRRKARLHRKRHHIRQDPSGLRRHKFATPWRFRNKKNRRYHRRTLQRARRNGRDPRARRARKRRRTRRRTRKKKTRRLAPRKWWLMRRYRAYQRKKRRKVARKPGFVRRCVVTGKDRSRYEKAHIRFLKASGYWKKFKTAYSQGKMSTMRRVLRRGRRGRKRRTRFTRRGRERKMKARRKQAMVSMQMMSEEPLLLQESLEGGRRGWCETFYTCKKGDKRNFKTWVKAQRYRQHRGACAHSNGLYGKRHKYWPGKFTFAQCRAKCDRMRGKCQGITMPSFVSGPNPTTMRRVAAKLRHVKRTRAGARKARFFRIAIKARERAQKARGHHRRQRSAKRRALRLKRLAMQARERARKVRPCNTRACRIAKAKKMARAAVWLRERARKARVASLNRTHRTRLSRWKMYRAREVARKARGRLANERKRKNHSRCLKWMWWPVKPKNHHWYRNKRFSQVAEFSRRAWRRANGYGASTPRMDFGPKGKRRVERATWKGKVNPRLMQNVLFLKAMALAVHAKMRTAKRGNKPLSAIGTFMWRFGIRKKTTNAYGEYRALAAHYTKFYSHGLGNYIMRHLKKSMRLGKGLVRHFRGYVYFNHKALGLRTQPDIFDKWSARETVYDRILRATGKLNNYILTAANGRRKFTKDKCMCSTSHLPAGHQFKRFGTCKTHFAYDKKPWCIVNWTCKKAQLNRGMGFKWRSC